MINIDSYRGKRYILASIALVYVVLIGFDIQHDDGIVGATRKNGFGCTCHNVNPNTGVNVWITGPATVPPNGSATYTLHMVGGASMTGGLNVAVAHGALGTTNAETKIVTGELTHTAPKTFINDSVAWTFTYHAPASPGRDTMFSAANSTNNNLIPDHGDQWNFGNDFVVTVANGVPGLSMRGIVGLTLMLLVGGIWMLVRRRETSSR
ncbi:MAG: hypothetical protein HYR76_11670 [Ignavibacteria bacterium]|nr:hypothetical protein [Ignavibacteria bacterium]MBI3766585.1 hypothetical protein [Ignavibacteriales bacterium]